MNCIKCQGPTSVIDSRSKPETVVRKRRCDSCGFRFSTTEVSYSADRIAKDRLRQREWARQRRARETPEERVARIKRWKTRKAARKEAAETGEPVQQIYERWGVA